MHAFIYSESALGDLADSILKTYPDNRIFTLKGDLGAGKTSFIKSMCTKLGVSSEEISSPTFSIINEYRTSTGLEIFHMDLYRIDEIDELVDMGFEDYLFTEGYCFIEWPEIACNFLENYIEIDIKLLDNNFRQFVFKEIN